jgi:hypothetical protein
MVNNGTLLIDAWQRPGFFNTAPMRLAFLFLVSFCLIAQSGEGRPQPDASSSGSTAPALRVVFLTPPDVEMPGGARERLTKIADAADYFYFNGMKHWGYSPGVKTLFRRGQDGLVEILPMKGKKPPDFDGTAEAKFGADVVNSAAKKYHLPAKGQVWWIFVYLGGRPARFNNWMGTGCARDGGFALVDYDSTPGEILPDQSLVAGFNGKYFLKGTLHELGHAFGLIHTGPDPELGIGNSLMGPTTVVYEKRTKAKTDHIYLSESSAAMLWKHPFFSGTDTGRAALPRVSVIDYKAGYNAADDRVIISGRLVSDQHAHSAIMTEDLGKPRDQYWVRRHTARIATDGTFQVTINKPPRTDGHYGIVFCFDNGIVTGDGVNVTFGNYGDIRKEYHFSKGKFEFGPP